MPEEQEEINLKKLQLYPVCRSNHPEAEKLLPSGSDAAVMWASGLGSNQTTPNTSAQAVPAPIVNRKTQLSTLIKWLQMTNQLTERPYDC